MVQHYYIINNKYEQIEPELYSFNTALGVRLKLSIIFEDSKCKWSTRNFHGLVIDGSYKGENSELTFTISKIQKDLPYFFKITVLGGKNPLKDIALLCILNEWTAYNDETEKYLNLKNPNLIKITENDRNIYYKQIENDINNAGRPDPNFSIYDTNKSNQKNSFKDYFKRKNPFSFDKLHEIPRFPVATLKEWEKMYIDGKISFFYNIYFDIDFNKYHIKKSFIIFNFVYILAVFYLLSFLFPVSYSIYKFDYIYLTGIFSSFLGILSTSYFFKKQFVLAFISVLFIIFSLFIDNDLASFLLKSYSVFNLLIILIKYKHSKVCSNIILNHEDIFVKSYTSKMFTIINNDSKKILYFNENPDFHERLITEFEDGLTV